MTERGCCCGCDPLAELEPLLAWAVGAPGTELEAQGQQFATEATNPVTAGGLAWGSIEGVEHDLEGPISSVPYCPRIGA